MITRYLLYILNSLLVTRLLFRIGGKKVMKKADMISAVAAAANITKKDAALAVDAVFDCLADELAQGNKATITGFGTFEAKVREERQGRNPQTGESITIPAHTAVTFKAGKGLKETVNG